MLVAKILETKTVAGIITVAPKCTVAEAAAILAKKGIGTVVVSENGETLDGILSERDIVGALGDVGAACLQDPVSRLMTRKVTTCTPQDRADHVLSQMTDGRFRHMPVMQAGRMIGVISIGDVVKARLTELAMEKDALEGMIMGH